MQRNRFLGDLLAQLLDRLGVMRSKEDSPSLAPRVRSPAPPPVNPLLRERSA